MFGGKRRQATGEAGGNATEFDNAQAHSGWLRAQRRFHGVENEPHALAACLGVDGLMIERRIADEAGIGNGFGFATGWSR
ncbi:hypothetical protein D3C87_2017640 [compost metagenome]